MSPEQAEYNNLDVDTRTDIYSLGVVLYELLVGTTPLERQQVQQAAFDEILRLIKEVEPPRPSIRLSASESMPNIAAQRSIDPKHLGTSLKGDLDWIVMKSLEKERSRRYDTANDLARDIERFLNEEAVEACPPSRAYRLKKYVRKHRTQVITVALVFAALLAGITGTTWQAVRATRAERDATKASETAIASEAKARQSEQQALRAKTDAEQAEQEVITALKAEEVALEDAERQFIDRLFRRIGYADELGHEERNSFVEWAAIADDELRLRVLERAFNESDTALRITRRAERVVHACVGMSARRRALAIEFLLKQQLDERTEPAMRVAACLLAMKLGSSSLPALPEAMARAKGPDKIVPWMTLEPLSKRIEETAVSFSAEQVTEVWDAFIKIVANNRDYSTASAAEEALAALVPHLTADQRLTQWRRLMQIPHETGSIRKLSKFSGTLKALAPYLSHQAITDGEVALAQLIGKADDYTELAAVTSTLADLAPHLSTEFLEDAEPMLHRLREQADTYGAIAWVH